MIEKNELPEFNPNPTDLLYVGELKNQVFALTKMVFKLIDELRGIQEWMGRQEENKKWATKYLKEDLKQLRKKIK